MNKCIACRVVAAAIILSSLLLADTGLGKSKQKYERTLHDYRPPEVTLVDQDGRKVVLEEMLSSGKPVLLDFIYATCTTICPVLSVGFSNFQKKLGPEADGVLLVSVSIDPDNDRPEVMKEYLKRYGARPGWEFLTGDRDDIVRVMRAFDAYVPNKMSHYPVTFMHAPGMDRWVRLYGLMGTSDLIREFRELLKKQTADR